jgi:hypothetical protein|tara:strand:+ start:273 stop:527 length:255 start_codon:yes stop_codon:yes gene_type:complete
MANTLSDHQDSEHFSYKRTWDEIEVMLNKAERVKNSWDIKYLQAKEKGNKKRIIECLRNMKALEGVIKTLRWTLGDINVEHPLN